MSWKDDPVTEKQAIFVRQLVEKISKNTGVPYAYTKPESKGQAHDLIAVLKEKAAESQTEPPRDLKTKDPELIPTIEKMRIYWKTANGKERDTLAGIARNMKSRHRKNLDRIVSGNEQVFLDKMEKRLTEILTEKAK